MKESEAKSSAEGEGSEKGNGKPCTNCLREGVERGRKEAITGPHTKDWNQKCAEGTFSVAGRQAGTLCQCHLLVAPYVPAEEQKPQA